MAARLERDVGITPEDELERETKYLLAERARSHEDRNFLQLFATAAHQNAVQHRYDADTLSQELNQEIAGNMQLHESFRLAKLETGNLWAASRANAVACSNLAARRMQSQSKSETELARLHGILQNETRAYMQAVQQSRWTTQALHAARAEVADQVQHMQAQKKQTDELLTTLEKIRFEGSVREHSVQQFLKETLRRLEADLARQRADYDAQEVVLQKQINHAPNASTFSPPSLATASAVQASSTAVPAGTLTSSPSAVPTGDFLTSIRGDLGLSTPDRSSGEAEPTALERQVAELRRRQASLESLWDDRSLKSQSALIGEHIAALASRAPERQNLGSSSICKPNVLASSHTHADPLQNTLRPQAANGLLYV
jgi:hypothetical protein